MMGTILNTLKFPKIKKKNFQTFDQNENKNKIVCKISSTFFLIWKN